MKKLTALLLALSLLFCAAACAKTETKTAEPVTLRVVSLKGPTSMGLVKLLQDNKDGTSKNKYESEMFTAADEVTAALVTGQADIALLPANAAATLFNKAGGFSVVAINTLGVLYAVEAGETIQSLSDLKGKTVLLTGKGTTPEYALRFLLARAGIEDDVTLEFKSEPTEIVTALTEGSGEIGILPQPFVTTALMQNTLLRIALNLTVEWDAVTSDSQLVTGVTVVRNEILENHPDQVMAFLEESAASVDYVNQNPAQAAEWIAELGIVPKAPVAQAALPGCNLVSITGKDMKKTLSGYLNTLYEQNPAAVGGKLPEDGFYYIP